jgi:uncharacterized membrane protein
MSEGKKRKPIKLIDDPSELPTHLSDEEQLEFWETHGLSEEFLDKTEDVPDDERPRRQEKATPISVRFDAHTLDRLKALAEHRGIGYQTLLKQFVGERLYEEEKRERLVSARNAAAHDEAWPEPWPENQARQVAQQAQDTVGQVAQQSQEAVGQVSQQAQDTAQGAAQQAQEPARQATPQAQGTAGSATLSVLKFNDPYEADRVLLALQGLQEQQIINLEDAAVVSWPQGNKKPTTRQLHGGSGALGGAFWGFLFGLIFFVPFLGAAIGAAIGAGSMADVGIDDEFIKQVREKVTEGTSALFALTSGATAPDKIIDELKQYDFEIISTNLPVEQENKLRETRF